MSEHASSIDMVKTEMASEVPDILRAQSELTTQVDRLTDAVVKMEERLVAIMKQPKSVISSDMASDWPEMSPVAYRMQSDADTVRRMVNRLYDLLDRIQI